MTVISIVPSASDSTTSGTISAAQSGINTPVSNATVVLAVGTGQSSWKATLTGANFTSSSTIVADHSSDGGTTWFASSFKVAGGITSITSIVGPAPVEMSGNDASISHIRVRCSVLGGGDSISVALRSGYGVGSIGLLSSIPAGTNVIGGITSTDLGTTADLAVVGDNTGSVSAKLRGLTKISNDVWDSTNHRLHVAVDNSNANGQATMVNSAPVVIASDQSNLPTNLKQINGQTPTLDNTTILATSMRGKGAGTAGDTALALNSAGDVKVAGDFTEVAANAITTSASSSGSGAAAGADFFTQQDVSAYKWFSVQFSGTWSATFTFQASNDNINWFSCNVQTVNISQTSTSTATSNNIYYGPISYRYLRVRCTTFSSNSSLGGVIELYTMPPLFGTVAVSQVGTWTIQPGNTQNTTAWLTAGATSNATQAANTASNTVVKASAGYLWSAVVTTQGTAQLDIYDNASTNSGTKLLSIPASAAIGTIYTFPGGAKAVNGITSNGVTNCPAVTFYYS